MSVPWSATALRKYCDLCGAIVSHGTLASLAVGMDARTLWDLSRIANVVGSDVECWWCPICSCAGAFGPIMFEDPE